MLTICKPLPRLCIPIQDNDGGAWIEAKGLNRTVFVGLVVGTRTLAGTFAGFTSVSA